MRIAHALVLMAVLLATSACGDEEPVVPTQPTAPTPTSETFSGRLTVNGAATHPFVTGASGSIILTLTELAPDSTAIIGVSLGTWNVIAGTCQLIITKDDATQQVQVSGVGGSAGAFCARVYDVGRLTAPTDYTLTVVHN